MLDVTYLFGNRSLGPKKPLFTSSIIAIDANLSGKDMLTIQIMLQSMCVM